MIAHAEKRILTKPVPLFDRRIMVTNIINVRATVQNRDYFQLFHVRTGLYPWQNFVTIMEPLFGTIFTKPLSKEQSVIKVCSANVLAPVRCNSIIQNSWALLNVIEGVVLFYELIGCQYNGEGDGELLHCNSIRNPSANYSFWDCGNQGIYMVMISFAESKWTTFARKINPRDVRIVIEPGNRIFLSTPNQIK